MPKTLHAIREFITGRRQELAEMVIEHQWRLCPALEQQYGTSGRAKCLEDVNYHLRYLSEAVGAAEPSLFIDYVTRVKIVLTSRNVPLEDLVRNFEAIQHVFEEQLPGEIQAPAVELVKSGIRALSLGTQNPTFVDASQHLGKLAHEYISALLRYERHLAAKLILQALEDGISIKDIYTHIFERCQHEIGRLWQSNIISVAQEHYCTASTHAIMSQLYPFIFRGQSNRRARL